MRNIEEYAKDYVNDYDFENYQVKYRRRKILEIIEQYAPESLLEIGCGLSPIGEFCNGLKMYTVVEPSKYFCEIACQKFSNNAVRGMGYEVINDFFSSSLCMNKNYDMIICSSLLHEVENPKNLLHEILLASNQNTIIHINVPNADSFHRILAVKSGLIETTKTFSGRNIQMQQHTVFDMNSLINIMSETGFDVIEQGQYFLKPFSHSQMAKMIEFNIIDEKILDGLYEMGKENFGSEIYVNARRK